MKSELKILNKENLTSLNYQLESHEIPIQIPDRKIFDLPEKVLILGNNKLLRSTIDYFFNVSIINEEFKGRIIHVELENEEIVDTLNKQNCLFTLFSRGLKGDKVEERWDIIASINQIIIASQWDKVIKSAINPNIEILICHHQNHIKLLDHNDSIKKKPPNSYIGKILSILYERYRRFKSKDQKFTVISLNPKLQGDLTLKEIILNIGKEWNLGETFLSWIRLKVNFFNSLLDKLDIGILPNNEKIIQYNKLNYKDNFLTVTENYHKLIIKKEDQKIYFPIPETDLNFEYTKNLDIFTSLNTWFNAVLVAFIPLAYLSGYNKTNEALMDLIIKEFFEKFLFDTIKRFVDLPEEQIQEWEKNTISRLKNPFNTRTLIEMSENLLQKFKSDFLFKMIDLYEKDKEIPDYIFFILAIFIKFYNVIEEEDGQFIGIRNLQDVKQDEEIDEENEIQRENRDMYKIIDDPIILKEFASTWRNVTIHDSKSIKIFLGYILTQQNIWGMDLSLWPKLMERTNFYLERLLQEDIGKITSELLLGIEKG